MDRLTETIRIEGRHATSDVDGSAEARRSSTALTRPTGFLRAAGTLITAAICGVSLTACGAESDSSGGSRELSETTPAPSGHAESVNWAVEGEPTTLDPIYVYNYYDNTILSNLCEPLIRLEPSLEYKNWLAEKATRTGPTTWVYEIRPGVKFWDGSPLTAEDVAFSLNRNIDPDVKPGSYFPENFSRVRSIKVTSPSEVTVELTKPDALWNQTLSLGGAYIVSKKYAEAQGADFGTPSGGLMCTGPFKLDSFRRGDSVVMSKNSDYWNPEAAAQSEQFVFNFIDDVSAQTQALAAGDVDGMYLRDPTGIPRLESADGNLYFGKGFLIQYLVPTLKQGPLSDPEIRQALSLAMDRQGIVETVFKGAAEAMRTQVGPAQFPAEPAANDVYQQNWDALGEPEVDLDAAKALVAEAGSPTETIVIGHISGGVQEQVAVAIQEAGRQIGLNVELDGMSVSAFYTLGYDAEAIKDAGIDAMSISFDNSLLDPLQINTILIPSVGSAVNYSHYSDPEVTRLLTEAYGEYDPVKRAQLVTEADKIIRSDLPLIPIVALPTILYMGPDITGAPPSPSHFWTSWAAQVGAS